MVGAHTTGVSKVNALRVVLVWTLLSFATACSATFDEQDLQGEYVATYENGTERVILRKDGRYTQDVTRSGEATVAHSGAWSYNSAQNRLTLTDCLGVSDGLGRMKPSPKVQTGACSFSVERRWLVVGQIRLGPNEGSTLLKLR